MLPTFQRLLHDADKNILFDSHDHLPVPFDPGTVQAFAWVSPPRTIPTQLVSSSYYALQASLFELRPDRLLTSATRWVPLTVRSVLLYTQQIRHYGLFANRCKGENVQRCRELLGLSQELPEVVNQSVQEMMLKLTGKDITLCPCCGKGKMHSFCLIPIGSGPSGFGILHPSG